MIIAQRVACVKTQQCKVSASGRIYINTSATELSPKGNIVAARDIAIIERDFTSTPLHARMRDLPGWLDVVHGVSSFRAEISDPISRLRCGAAIWLMSHGDCACAATWKLCRVAGGETRTA